jgi:hypothetical protein
MESGAGHHSRRATPQQPRNTQGGAEMTHSQFPIARQVPRFSLLLMTRQRLIV